MKILELRASNIKRLSAVEITPDGNVVVVGGRNGQGKTSVLDSIMYGFAGKKSIPKSALKQGEKSGRIEIKVDGDESKSLPPLRIIRTFDAKGTQLEILSEDGYEAPTPQTILDSLCSRIAFDPLEFVRLKPKDQLEQLKELVGLDFTALDRERQQKFDERTRVNRDVKSLASQVDALPRLDVPEQEVSVADLLREAEKLEAVQKANAAKRDSLHEAKDDLRQLQKEAEDLRERIIQLQADLSAKEAGIRNQQVEVEELSKQVADLKDPDVESIRSRIATAEQTNRQVREAQKRVALAEQLDARQEESAALSDRIKGIDAEKQQAMESASWPVAGLGFDDDGVTLNGLSFSQASQAEKLRVSVAMGMALNPTLKVLLIRDASLLDADSMRMIGEMADSEDFQVWLERVTDGDGAGCSVVIEEGAVKAGKEPVPA